MLKKDNNDPRLDAINDLSIIIKDLCVIAAHAEGYNATILLGAMGLALARLNLEQAKPGFEPQAFESMMKFIRTVHEEAVAMRQEAAEDEAKQARQKGSIQ